MFVDVALWLAGYYYWHRYGGSTANSDLVSLSCAFGVAVAFEFLVALLVFVPRRVGRLMLIGIAVAAVCLSFWFAVLQWPQSIAQLAFATAWTLLFALLTVLLSSVLLSRVSRSTGASIP